jgi:hypothetical protein
MNLGQTDDRHLIDRYYAPLLGPRWDHLNRLPVKEAQRIRS